MRTPVDHDALADGERLARRVLRVSADVRRGAAPYGVASWYFLKARTHDIVLV